MPVNVVILIDLNSLPDYRKQKSAADLVQPSTSTDLNFSTLTGETGTSLFEKSAVDLPEDSNRDEQDEIEDRLMTNAKWIQEHVLTLLSKEATRNNEVDYSGFYWSYSFYNSAKDLPSKFGKRFHTLDPTSFEAFEKHLVEELRDVYAQNKNFPQLNKMSCLSSVIKNLIYGDLPWTEPKVEAEDSQMSRRRDKNVLYTFLRVPRSENECLNFVDDVSVLARSHTFLKTLLPPAFFKEFHNRFRIQLNFVDMWFAHENINMDSSWDGTYAAPLGKVLHYLNGGRIIPLSKMEFVAQGLPSYYDLLTLTLKAGSETKTTENKRLSGLQKSSSFLKISPETEDPFALSMKSNSTTNSISRKQYGGSLIFNNSQGREMNSMNSSNMSMNRNDSFHAPIIKTEIVDNELMCGRARESPEKTKSTKKKRRPLKIKRKIPSTQGSSDDEPKYSAQMCNSDERIGKPKGFENNVQSRLSLNSNRSQEDVTTPVGQAEKTRVNDKLMKLPLTAPSKLAFSTSKILSRGHALVAEANKEKPPSPSSKEDYIARVLKRNDNGSQTEAGKKRSQQRTAHLKEMKSRLTAFVKSISLNENDSEEEIVQAFSLKLGTFKDMVLKDGSITDISLVSLAQSLVNVLTVTLRQFATIQNLKTALENIIFVSYESLNVDIMQQKINFSTSLDAIAKCKLQILLKFEMAWLWPGDEEDTLEIRDDVLKLLNLITANRQEPPIRDFIVDTLMDAYAEVQGPLVAAVFKGMEMSLPKKMQLLMSPAAVEKNFPDDVSQASSLDSSLAQLDSISVDKSHYQSNSLSQNGQSVAIKPSFRYASYPSYNPRRPITVPAQKLARSHKIKGDSAKKKLALAVCKASPKRVRRNLFNVQKTDRKDLKTLLSLTTTTRFSRSPSVKFRSPCSMKSRSPRSPAYIRGSKRRLHMDDTADTHDGAASPGGVLCPESPATPNLPCFKRSKMSTSFGSTENNVIQASQGGAKIKHAKRPLTGVDSSSFYSTKSTSEKAIASEKSGEKMMAARIKDSVDLTQSLLLDDLEFVQGSPDKTNNSSPFAEETPETKLENSARGIGLTESPYVSKSSFSENEVADSEKPRCIEPVVAESMPPKEPIVNREGVEKPTDTIGPTLNIEGDSIIPQSLLGKCLVV